MELRIVEEAVTDTGLSPAAVWPIVADTDRLNREAGLSPVSFTPLKDRGAARLLAETVIGPFKLLFEEQPFEWRSPERLTIRRKILRGPARQLAVHFTIEPREGGSRVRTRIEVELVSRAWAPAATLIAKRVAGRMDRAIQTLAASSRALSPRTKSAIARLPAPARPAAWTERILAEAPRADPALAARLVAHVESASEHELWRIRPYELAASWGAGRREVLELCLSATLAGMLSLSWDLVCPSCRQPSSQLETLESLGEAGHCDQCDLGFGLELDRSVEATFRPTPSARVVEEIRFCSGGPAMTPHVIAQGILGAGSPLLLEAPKEVARLRLFARGGATASVELRDGAPSVVSVNVGPRAFSSGALELAPGGRLELSLEGGGERHVKLERVDWVQRAATAFDVSLIPQFRDRFSGEVLRRGVALAIARVSLVFTDLGASTEMYTRHGDAAAFKMVQDHFELLAAIIAEHEGTLVKTIGDAVMAAFPDDRRAVAASAAMLRAFGEFRAARPSAARSSLKIGLYSGPCYVVQANGILDYFGQTVNLAARLQGQAKDDQLVVADGVWSEAAGWGIEGLELVERDEAKLKGIASAVPIARLALGAKGRHEP